MLPSCMRPITRRTIPAPMNRKLVARAIRGRETRRQWFPTHPDGERSATPDLMMLGDELDALGFVVARAQLDPAQREQHPRSRENAYVEGRRDEVGRNLAACDPEHARSTPQSIDKFIGRRSMRPRH